MNLLTRAALIASALLLIGCAEPQEPKGLISEPSKTNISYIDDVKPILESRCIACHACYDAPCQLKLTAHDGVIRGASTERVYDAQRLLEAPLSRLFFDANSVTEWRAAGFHSVLSQHVEEDSEQSSIADQFSTLVGMLDLKADNPLPQKYQDIDTPIDDQTEWQCANGQDEFNDFAEDYPQRGMPYGLPGLSMEETNTIRQWVAAGASDDTDDYLSESEQSWVVQWEDFLNQDSLKTQLVARYIYEHLFLASLHSEQTTPGRYFQLVRSTTPPGEPIDIIATRRPYDDPEVGTPYYRLRLDKETVVAKTHIPYRLDNAKFEDWTDWFFNETYDVTELPSYDIASASNPFKTFAQLPVDARYRFMLNEANFTIKGFIKGPVCKGPRAVNVINEHFWVFFIDPKYQSGEQINDYLVRSESTLDMPAEQEDTLDLFGSWQDYAEKEKLFLQERTEFVKNNLSDDGVFDLDLIWDGDGSNANAALTIFRHLDNASVNKGLNGQAPKTAWVIDYPLLERIHYLLVAGFDVYGNVSHQLLSRIYMDFLRMEGESMFLNLLPSEQRITLRQHWYREADERIDEFMLLADPGSEVKSIIDNASDDPKLALYEKLKTRIGSALNQQYQVHEDTSQIVKDGITRLQSGASEGFMLLPEVSFVQVYSGDSFRYFTLTRNVGHLNNTSVLFEKLYIEEVETTISMIPGFVGPRPNAFMRVAESEFEKFTDKILAMKESEDYTSLMDVYGVRRTDPQFWTHYDQFLAGFKIFSAIDYGVLDLNKLENR